MDPKSSAGVELPLRSQNFPTWRFYEDYVVEDLKYRAPLSIAILSVAFQHFHYWNFPRDLETFFQGYSPGSIWSCRPFSVSYPYLRPQAVLQFYCSLPIAAIDLFPRWTALANHTYLALWTIPFAVFFKEWWKSDLYSVYLRVTLGIVMFAAVAQKLLAGTYIDGSYIYWLSNTRIADRTYVFVRMRYHLWCSLYLHQAYIHLYFVMATHSRHSAVVGRKIHSFSGDRDRFPFGSGRICR